MDMSIDSPSARGGTVRALSTWLYRRPTLYLLLLLVPPLLWFGAVYLGSLLTLLWQGFYTFDDFTMAVTPDLTLANLPALFNPANYDIILRTLTMAIAGVHGQRHAGVPDGLVHGALHQRQRRRRSSTSP